MGAACAGGTDSSCLPGEDSPATWNYVGQGRGDFEPVRSYSYVGPGAGSFQRDHHRGARYAGAKKCCLLVGGGTIIAAVLVLTAYDLLNGQAQHKESYAAARQTLQQPPKTSMPKIPGLQPVVQPPFLCTTAATNSVSGSGAMVAAALLEAAWGIMDGDADGGVGKGELAGCRNAACVSKRAQLLLVQAAGSGPRLRRSTFAAALGRAGLLASPSTHSLTQAISAALAEAAWIAASDSEGFIALAKLDALTGSSRSRGLITDREQALLSQADADKDGQLDRGEFQSGLGRAGLALFLPHGNARRIAAAVAAEVLWTSAYAGNGFMGHTELENLQLQHQPPQGLELSKLIPASSPGLRHDPFVESVASATHFGNKLFHALMAKPAADAPIPAAVEPQEAWAASKMSWCCENVALGCSGTSTTSVGYDCRAAPVDQRKWSPTKRRWCCRSGLAACPPPETTTTALGSVPLGAVEAAANPPAQEAEVGLNAMAVPVDCSQRSDTGWPESHKEYCCHATGRFCEHTKLVPKHPDLFDCGHGQNNWQVLWTEQKKAYCCKHHNLGCSPRPLPL